MYKYLLFLSLILSNKNTIISIRYHPPSPSPSPTAVPHQSFKLPNSFVHTKVTDKDNDSCTPANQNECGQSSSGLYCSYACAWNTTLNQCVATSNYPLPPNSSLQTLVDPSSPLNSSEWITLSFYGDSITWLGVYESVLSQALSIGTGTSNLKFRLINQGVDGGTIHDLVVGYSPWGHLNPSLPQSNITFVETLDQDYPDIVGIQIGINDVWQNGPTCGTRCSNITQFINVLANEIVQPVQQRGIRIYLVSVSTIGERENETNPFDSTLDEFAAGVQSYADSVNVPFINVRQYDLNYISNYNCMNLSSGLLSYDGVHPLVPRGAVNLANHHAEGILQAIQISPLPPRPLPQNAKYGGRIFLTSKTYDLDLQGINGADTICTQEAGGLPAKALLTDENGCQGGTQPCRRATITPFLGDGQINWTLLPNAVYYQWDNVTIAGYTASNSLFSFPFFDNPMDCINQASGMNIDWTTQTNGTCGNWEKGSNQGGPPLQSIGWSCALDNNLLYGGAKNWACNSNKLLCVTQGV